MDNIKRIEDQYDDKSSIEYIEKAFNKEFFDLITDGVIIHKNRNILFVNKQVHNMLGKDILDLKRIIKTLRIKKGQIKVLNERIKKLENGEKIDPYVYKILNKKNEIMYIKTQGTYKVLENGEKIITTIAKDVTEDKILQNRLDKLTKVIKQNKIQEDSLVRLSHELRTPINLILSTMQLINKCSSENKCFEKQKHYNNLVTNNCYRMIKFINNIIDSTKINNGYLNVLYKNLNIVKVVEDITLSTLPYTDSKGIKLIFDTDIEEKIIAIDKEKIERILLNILSNSVKFTPPNGEILVKIFASGQKNIKISIKDSGIGMSKETLNKICNKYHKGSSELNKDYEGSGIGLYIVKSLVDAHKGTLDIFSKENEGTEFVITLPANLIKEETLTKKVQYYKDPQIVNIEFSDISS